MGNLAEIEAITTSYANVHNKLAETVQTMEKEIDAVKFKWLNTIRPLAVNTAQEKAVLFTAIDESRHLFIKPRSYTIAGIKVGLQKKKTRIEIADEDKTIELIRKKLTDKADLLIKEEPKLIIKAVENLTEKELKAIGITVPEETDEIIIKSDADKIEKFINELIKEKTNQELN